MPPAGDGSTVRLAVHRLDEAPRHGEAGAVGGRARGPHPEVDPPGHRARVHQGGPGGPRQDVREGAFQQAGVGEHGRQAVREREAHVALLAALLGGQGGQRGGEHRGQGGRPQQHRLLAGPQPVEVQQVGDQAFHPPHLGGDPPPRRPRQVGGLAAQRGERGAQVLSDGLQQRGVQGVGVGEGLGGGGLGGQPFAFPGQSQLRDVGAEQSGVLLGERRSAQGQDGVRAEVDGERGLFGALREGGAGRGGGAPQPAGADQDDGALQAEHLAQVGDQVGHCAGAGFGRRPGQPGQHRRFGAGPVGLLGAAGEAVDEVGDDPGDGEEEQQRGEVGAPGDGEAVPGRGEEVVGGERPGGGAGGGGRQAAEPGGGGDGQQQAEQGAGEGERVAQRESAQARAAVAAGPASQARRRRRGGTAAGRRRRGAGGTASRPGWGGGTTRTSIGPAIRMTRLITEPETSSRRRLRLVGPSRIWVALSAWAKSTRARAASLPSTSM